MWQEAVCWLQLCCHPDVSGYILHSQLHLLLETPVYWQIHGIFHDCLFGNHPTGDGNIGCVGCSWVRAEWLLERYFFLFAGGWDFQSELSVGSHFCIWGRWGDGPRDDHPAVVISRAGPLSASFMLCPGPKQDVSLLPLPFMWVWFPRHLQGQRDNFVARVGGVFFLSLCHLRSGAVLEVLWIVMLG